MVFYTQSTITVISGWSKKGDATNRVMSFATHSHETQVKLDWPFRATCQTQRWGSTWVKTTFFAFLDRWGFHLLYACFFAWNRCLSALKTLLFWPTHQFNRLYSTQESYFWDWSTSCKPQRTPTCNTLLERSRSLLSNERDRLYLNSQPQET